MADTATIRATARTERTASALAAAALVVVTLVAAVLRFHNLGDASLWRDEAATWQEAQGSFLDIIRATAADNYPPLHNLLVALSMRFFGDGEWALRLPSALCGVLAVPALYWVGRMASGRLAGLFAALLLAFSYFHIWQSENARGYALMALAAILFAGSALWFGRRVTWPRAVAAILSGAALLYSHPYGTLVWLAIAIATLIVLLARTESERVQAFTWLLLQVVIALLFLPWAWLLLLRAHDIVAGGFWIPYPTVTYVLQTLTAIGSGFLATLIAILLAAAVFLAPAVAIDGIATVAGPPLRIGAPAVGWFVLAWLVAPLLMALAASILVQPIIVSYYLIGCLPALLLLAGMGLARFATGALTTAIAFAVALATAGLGLAYGIPGAAEDWRGAAVFVEQNLPADGCILVSDALTEHAIAYYDRQLPCVVYPAGVPETKANVLFAMLVGDQAGLASTLSSPSWRAGQTVHFRQLTVLPLQRTGG